MSKETTGGKSISYTINYGNYAQQGWQCPLCKRILAPFVTECPCRGQLEQSLTTANAILNNYNKLNCEDVRL